MEVCQICGKSYKRITTSHLKTHDITLEEYLKLYKKEEYKERKLVEFLMENYVNISDKYKFLYYTAGESASCSTITITKDGKRKYSLCESDLKKHLRGYCSIGVYQKHVKITRLIAFDIDIKSRAKKEYKSIENCKEILNLMVSKLFEFGITEEHLIISFSGSKGYHVDIILDSFFNKDLARKFQSLVEVEVFREASEEARKGVSIDFKGTDATGYKLPLCFHYKTKEKAYLCDEYGREIDDLECLTKKQFEASKIKELLDINSEDIELYNDLNKVVSGVNTLDMHKEENKKRRERVKDVLENGLTEDYVSKHTKSNSRHEALYEVVLYLKLVLNFDRDKTLSILPYWIKNTWERSLVDSEILRDIRTTVDSVYNKRKGQFFDIATKDFNITKKHMKEIQSVDEKHKQKTLALRKLYFILMIHSNYFANIDNGEFSMAYSVMEKMGAVTSDRSLLKKQLERLEELGKITIVKQGVKKSIDKVRFIEKIEYDVEGNEIVKKERVMEDTYDSNVYKLNFTIDTDDLKEQDKYIKHCKMLYNCKDCLHRCSCELLDRRDTSKFIPLSEYKYYKKEGCPYNKD